MLKRCSVNNVYQKAVAKMISSLGDVRTLVRAPSILFPQGTLKELSPTRADDNGAAGGSIAGGGRSGTGAEGGHMRIP